MVDIPGNNPIIEKIETSDREYWRLKYEDFNGEEIRNKYNLIYENLHFYWSFKSKNVSNSTINSWVSFYTVFGRTVSKCKDNYEKQKRLLMKIAHDTNFDSQRIWGILTYHKNPYSLLPLSYAFFKGLADIGDITPLMIFQSEMKSYLDDQIKWFDFKRNNPNDPSNDLILLPAPWEHQENAIRLWEQNNYQGLIEMATGTGKTYTAFLAIERLSKKLGRPPKVIVVNNTNILLTQWTESFQKAFGFKEKANWFNTRTVQGLINKDINDMEFDLLIVDEIHNLMGPKFQKSLQIPAPYRIGLSATVKPHHLGLIEKYIGKKIFEFNLKKAIESGIIVPFKLKVYIANLNSDEQAEYNIYNQDLGILFTEAKKQGISSLSNTCSQANNSALCPKYWELINKIRGVIHNAEKKEELTLELIRDYGKEKKIITFFERIETITKISSYLNDSDINYFEVHGDLNRNLINNQLEKFKQVKAGVLLGAKMISAGIDIPDADVGINAQFEKGRLQLIQRIGRLARKSWDKPDKFPDFYHIIAVPGGNYIENDEVNSIFAFSRSIGVDIEFIDKTGENLKNSDQIIQELKHRQNISGRILFDPDPKERIETIKSLNTAKNLNLWQINSLIVSKWCDINPEVRNEAKMKVDIL